MRDWNREVRARLAAAKIAPERAVEIEEELVQHLRDRYEALQGQGMDEHAVEQTLLAELEQGLAEEVRRAEGTHAPTVPLGAGGNGFFESIVYDLRYGFRSLRLSPGFTLICVISLTLGIGANTAIFQVLNAVRLRAVSVKEPQQLAIVTFKQPHTTTGEKTGRYSEFSYAQWQAVQRQQQAFRSIAAWGTDSWNIAKAGEIRRAQGLWVSGDFFSTLEATPWLGRTIGHEDDKPGCGTGPAVISYSFWQREYGGGNDVLGRKLMLDGRPFEVVGVMPPDFDGVEVGRRFDIAVPLCTETLIDASGPLLTIRHGFWLNIIGRLKPGWTVDKANAQLQSISAGVMQETLPTVYNAETARKYLANEMRAVSGANGYSRLRDTYETPLLLLLAISGIVLLIACANLANLMLARASVREREIVVRLALGASRARVVRQLLSEGVLLAFAGAAGGIAIALALTRALVSWFTTLNDHFHLEHPLDWHVIGFTSAVAALTCILFSLLPAFKATRLAPAQVLNSAGRTATTGRERFGVRRVLATVQIAMSLMLLIAGVLFARTLNNLLQADIGFDKDHVLVVEFDVSRIRMPQEQLPAFEENVLKAVREIPGVESAGESSVVPLSGNGWNEQILIGGQKQQQDVYMANVSDGYFHTMAVPLLAGRDFDERDTPQSPHVAIVDETFARDFFPGQSAIGKTFKIDVYPGIPQYEYQIVGVARNTKYLNIREPAHPTAYYAQLQTVVPSVQMAIMMRSPLPLSSLRAGVSKAMNTINGDIVFEYSVLKTEIDQGLFRERMLATLSGAFAFLAAVLACVGLYGVIAYIVVRRTTEIGVRIALGALPSSILKMVLTEAAKLLATGAAVGILLAVLLMRSASTLLYGLPSYDPPTIAMCLAGLTLVTIAATLVPAARAARLDPMVALREQ